MDAETLSVSFHLFKFEKWSPLVSFFSWSMVLKRPSVCSYQIAQHPYSWTLLLQLFSFPFWSLWWWSSSQTWSSKSSCNFPTSQGSLSLEKLSVICQLAWPDWDYKTRWTIHQQSSLPIIGSLELMKLFKTTLACQSTPMPSFSH